MCCLSYPPTHLSSSASSTKGFSLDSHTRYSSLSVAGVETATSPSAASSSFSSYWRGSEWGVCVSNQPTD